MTDLEIMKLAAKAAGYELEAPIVGGEEKLYRAGELLQWNPLTDDGDALRLAVSLSLEIRPDVGAKRLAVACDGAWEEADFNDSPFAATRRAITRAAAEIGKAMP